MTTGSLEAVDIKAILRRVASKVWQSLSDWDDVVFIGIRSGGEHVARQVVKILESKTGTTIPLGALDIALYRDDLSQRLSYPEVRRTDIPFDVGDKIVVLVDDVLNTGRSVRAAIEQIIDLGRPRRIYLLVLFDRGGRELPIQADFVGRKIDLPADKALKLDIDPAARGKLILTEVKR